MIQENNRITAESGYTFVRIHDGFEMGEEIYLGMDYSTGEPLPEDAPDPDWSGDRSFVAPAA